MRHITKKLHGSMKLDALSRADRDRRPQNKDDARKSWGSLDKKGILDLLLLEQYGLCCYSEIRADQYGWGYHIEHVENKSQNPARTFDYNNLLASAFSSDILKKISNQNVFGGHTDGKKGTYQPVNMNLFISPLQADCANFFIYTSDGLIYPNSNLDATDQQKAQYTIDILNLNSAELITRRAQRWKDLEELWDKHKEQSDLDLMLWLEIELLPRNGKLESFFSMKRQYLDKKGQEGQDVLAGYRNGELL